MLNRRYAFATIAVLAAGMPAGALAADPQPQTRAEVIAKLDANYAKLDTNKDGSITKPEIEAAQKAAAAEANATIQARLQQEFTRLDADKNGQLSLAEFRGGASVRASGDATASLQRMDSDKDGKISSTEFRARALALFDQLDKNKDGTLSAAEQKAAQASR